MQVDGLLSPRTGLLPLDRQLQQLQQLQQLPSFVPVSLLLWAVSAVARNMCRRTRLLQLHLLLLDLLLLHLLLLHLLLLPLLLLHLVLFFACLCVSSAEPPGVGGSQPSSGKQTTPNSSNRWSSSSSSSSSRAAAHVLTTMLVADVTKAAPVSGACAAAAVSFAALPGVSCLFRDVLLLECGFICCFAPIAIETRDHFASTALLLLLRLLLFKLLFSSAASKLCSSLSSPPLSLPAAAPHWRNLTSLHYHYWTQPLPSPGSCETPLAASIAAAAASAAAAAAAAAPRYAYWSRGKKFQAAAVLFTESASVLLLSFCCVAAACLRPISSSSGVGEPRSSLLLLTLCLLQGAVSFCIFGPPYSRFFALASIACEALTRPAAAAAAVAAVAAGACALPAAHGQCGFSPSSQVRPCALSSRRQAARRQPAACWSRGETAAFAAAAAPVAVAAVSLGNAIYQLSSLVLLSTNLAVLLPGVSVLAPHRQQQQQQQQLFGAGSSMAAWPVFIIFASETQRHVAPFLSTCCSDLAAPVAAFFLAAACSAAAAAWPLLYLLLPVSFVVASPQGFGLFSVVTTGRLEVVLEELHVGPDEKPHWVEVFCPYKPGRSLSFCSFTTLIVLFFLFPSVASVSLTVSRLVSQEGMGVTGDIDCAPPWLWTGHFPRLAWRLWFLPLRLRMPLGSATRPQQQQQQQSVHAGASGAGGGGSTAAGTETRSPPYPTFWPAFLEKLCARQPALLQLLGHQGKMLKALPPPKSLRVSLHDYRMRPPEGLPLYASFFPEGKRWTELKAEEIFKLEVLVRIGGGRGLPAGLSFRGTCAVCLSMDLLFVAGAAGGAASVARWSLVVEAASSDLRRPHLLRAEALPSRRLCGGLSPLPTSTPSAYQLAS
ncbi:hypothetical protein ACSSS7_003060 [Eimeria intestinalis]